MITEMRKIAVTESSWPFISADRALNLSQYGYVEEEYFQSGTANIYEEKTDGGGILHGGEPESDLTVSTADAPYTTRLLIRRPSDFSRFSGNVVIEILNSSADFDIDRDWILTWRHIVRHGDIYIGITSKGHVVDALKKFDPVRYADINWANPTPDREPPAQTTFFDYRPQYELGLFWDMLVDLAKLLRTGSELNPIAQYGRNWLYLVGWSQSGSYLARIINTFAPMPENRADGPLFDGYLNTGSGSGNKPINSYCGGGHLFTGGRTGGASLMVADAPVIAVNTESENRLTYWHGDADEPGYRFRTWQIPCSSHDTKYTLLDYYEPIKEDLARGGVELSWEGYLGEPMNTPYEPIFCAALQALFNWVREGIPAPHAPAIQTYITEKPTDRTMTLIANEKDVFGNALGGIRYPVADCPTARYQSYSDREDGQIQMMFGQCAPFSVGLLTELYGDLEGYRAKAAASTDKAVAKGFILPEDRDYMIEACTTIAASRGLK